MSSRASRRAQPNSRPGDFSSVRRKVDDLGRVVIPSSIRKLLDIREGDEVEVHVEDGQVVMRVAADQCAFCSGTEHLEMFQSKAVCWSCMAAIRALDRERTGDVSSPFGFAP
ncbi:MAG: AbrB/MazE/SpoVT family DNA-binding domain-containing protein [Egibacteraceae bacterium]